MEQKSMLPTPAEAWFAAAGLLVAEVDACPRPDCALCRPALEDAA